MLVVQKLLKKPTLNASAYFTARTMTAKRLHEKVAIVTASTEGIGFAIAKGLAENGAKVVVSSRKEEKVKLAVDNLNVAVPGNSGVSGVVCDAGREDHRKHLVDFTLEKHGKLDIVVLSAGTSGYYLGPMLETPESSWDQLFNINVKCGFLMAQLVAPHLRKTKGSMLFMGSVTGYSPFKDIGAYSVSKTALLGLVKVLAAELGPDGVRVNCIAPGFIKTNFSSTLTMGPAAEGILADTSLKRFGLSEECAGAAVFLSSDEASYITGETVSINGGMPARL